jgi:hypothetical protein
MHADCGTHRILRGALGLVAVAALLAGCSSTKKDAATTTTAATSTTAATTSTTAAPSTTAAGATTTSTTAVTGTTTAGPTSPTATVPSGNYYVYFKGSKDGTVEGQAVTLVSFDEVQFLTGSAALAAAKAHHAVAQDATSLDDDYYIVNDNTLLRTLAVVPDAQVSKLGCDGGCSTQVPSSATEVAAAKGLFKILVQNVRGVSTVTSVEGVFVP